MFQMTFILIAYFDWLLGPRKGQILKRIFKNILLRNCLLNEADITYMFLALASTKNVFCSSQIRTLVAMATFSFHRLIMGKSENLLFLQSHWRFCRNVYLVVLYALYYFCPNTLF